MCGWCGKIVRIHLTDPSWRVEVPDLNVLQTFIGGRGLAGYYRGRCHLRAYPISHEILRKPVATDRFSFHGKARMIKIGEDLNAVAESLTARSTYYIARKLNKNGAPVSKVAKELGLEPI